MSALAHDLRRWTALIRDLRHMSARAAPDLADWLVHLELEGKADRTLYEYVRKVAPLLREFPEKATSEFTPADVSLILTRTPKRSREQVRSIINRFFVWAEMHDRTARSPMGKVPKIKHPERRIRDIFTVAEVATLEALPNPDGALFALLFGTGLRKAEARRLTRANIDLDRRRLIVRQGKGGKDRVVALTPSAIQAVADLDLLETLRREDHLWYSHPGGGKVISRRFPIGDTTFSSWYERQLKRAGVRYLNPHTTRHTFATRWLRRGGSLHTLSRALGHASIRTTADLYAHLDLRDLRRDLALIEAWED
jgi:integrase